MASSDDERAIVTQPAHYFEIQGKSLSERISQIKLSEEAEAEIARDATVKLICDKALGIFKLGQFVHAALTLYCGPVLRHAAEPTQAANCRSSTAS